MSDCELLSGCLFFNDTTQDISEMAEIYKKQYCKGDHVWCGRYMVFKALQRELEREKNALDLPLTEKEKIKASMAKM